MNGLRCLAWCTLLQVAQTMVVVVQSRIVASVHRMQVLPNICNASVMQC